MATVYKETFKTTLKNPKYRLFTTGYSTQFFPKILKLTAADFGLNRIDSDPLLVMLKKLEAASRLTSDTESDADPNVPYAIY